MRTVSASPGNVPASTSALYWPTAPRIVPRRSAYWRACFGVQSPQPSVSVMTWIWPEHPAPAPMPIVGIRSRSVIACGELPGHELEHDRERAGLLDRERVGEQRPRLLAVLALDADLAQRVDRLGREPDVAHDRDARP